jgi:chondroitin AC lyase
MDMIRSINFIVVLTLLILKVNGATQALYGESRQQPDIEIIQNRMVAELLRPEVNNDRITLLMNALREDGSWPDINYDDVSRTGFEHTRHVQNLVELGRAYRKPESLYCNSQELKKVIHSALDFWLTHDFIGDNWHVNEIGTPLQWARFLLLFGTELTGPQVREVVRMAKRAHLQAWGARPGGDRIKIAAIMVKVALFENNERDLKTAVDAMAEQIEVTSGRGLKPDFSFHHRTDRVTSTLSYGTGYAASFADWAPRLAGTSFRFPEEKLQLLTDFYLEGVVPMMVHGHYRDPGAMNRGMASPGALRPGGSALPLSLLQASNYREQELKNLVSIRNGEKKPDLRATYFLYHSEYFSHQRPNYFTSVRMYSDRSNNMESPHNEQSLKHHHFADGANFISRTGQEYLDIFPVWDWQKIPGTTVVQKPSLPGPGQIVKEGLRSFVGGVTDREYGAAAFDFESPHDPLKVRKSWFFFENEFVCLGTGISSTSEHPVATTLNQCLLDGDVRVRHGNNESSPTKGIHNLKDVTWIHHDNTAYLFTSPTNVQLENRQFSGRWSSITGSSWAREREDEHKDLFSLWLDHGQRPNQASYQYIVIPGIDVSEVEKYRANSPIEILSNTPAIQGAKHKGLGICQIAFYEKGSIDLGAGIVLSIESRGLVMVHLSDGKVEKITAADPTRLLKTMHLKISSRIEGNGQDWKAIWNRRGGYSDIYIKLPSNEYAGKSVVIDSNTRTETAELYDPFRKDPIEVGNRKKQGTEPRFHVGQEYGGGIVFWVDETGRHGLIAAKEDQSEGMRWTNGPARVTTGLGDHYARVTNARGDGIGAGKMNTQLIIAQQTEDDFFGNFAAKVCGDYEGEGYGDWYLPSKAELNLMYEQKDVIGNFASSFYWSSTEYNIGFAWEQYFHGYGGQYTSTKGTSRVRCIRSF